MASSRRKSEDGPGFTGLRGGCNGPRTSLTASMLPNTVLQAKNMNMSQIRSLHSSVPNNAFQTPTDCVAGANKSDSSWFSFLSVMTNYLLRPLVSQFNSGISLANTASAFVSNGTAQSRLYADGNNNSHSSPYSLSNSLSQALFNFGYTSNFNNRSSQFCTYDQVNVLNPRLSTSCPANCLYTINFPSGENQHEDFGFDDNHQFYPEGSNFLDITNNDSLSRKSRQPSENKIANENFFRKFLNNLYLTSRIWLTPLEDEFKNEIFRNDYSFGSYSSNLCDPSYRRSAYASSDSRSETKNHSWPFNSKIPMSDNGYHRVFPSLLSNNQKIDHSNNSDQAVPYFSPPEHLCFKKLCDKKMSDLILSMSDIVKYVLKLSRECRRSMSESSLPDTATLEQLLTRVEQELDWCENCFNDNRHDNSRESCHDSLKQLKSLLFGTGLNFIDGIDTDEHNSENEMKDIDLCSETCTESSVSESVTANNLTASSNNDTPDSMSLRNQLERDRQRRKRNKTRKKNRRVRRKSRGNKANLGGSDNSAFETESNASTSTLRKASEDSENISDTESDDSEDEEFMGTVPLANKRSKVPSNCNSNITLFMRNVLTSDDENDDDCYDDDDGLNIEFSIPNHKPKSPGTKSESFVSTSTGSIEICFENDFDVVIFEQPDNVDDEENDDDEDYDDDEEEDETESESETEVFNLDISDTNDSDNESDNENESDENKNGDADDFDCSFVSSSSNTLPTLSLRKRKTSLPPYEHLNQINSTDTDCGPPKQHAKNSFFPAPLLTSELFSNPLCLNRISSKNDSIRICSVVSLSGSTCFDTSSKSNIVTQTEYTFQNLSSSPDICLPLSEEEIRRNIAYESNNYKANLQVIEANRRWNEAMKDITDNYSSPNESDTQTFPGSSTPKANKSLSKKKCIRKRSIRFTDEEPEIIPIDVTEIDCEISSLSRSRYWEFLALDRIRHEEVISAVLSKEHRERIYRERFEQAEQAEEIKLE